MTDEIYQVLLDAPVELPEAKKVAKTDKPAVKKMPWRQIKEKLIVLVSAGDTQGLESFLEEQPQITKTTFWNNQITREAIEVGRLDSLRYLIDKGLTIKASGYNDIVWRKALLSDDAAMFKFLFEQGAVKWAEGVKSQPYLAQQLDGAPKVTKFLIEQYGVGLNLLDKNVLSEGLQASVIAGLISVGMEHPELLDSPTILKQLRALKMGKGDTERWSQVGEKLWTDLATKDRPDLLQQLIKEKIFPKDSGKLINVWYEAMRYGRNKLMHWLSQAPTIKQQIQSSWPNDPTKQKSQYWWHTPREHSLENIQDLDTLGLDLTAKTHQNVPWIHTGGELSKGVIMWIAKNHPELFECKNEQGVSLMEILGSEKKAFAEKSLLKGALVSRHKPLRTKVVKGRL